MRTIKLRIAVSGLVLATALLPRDAARAAEVVPEHLMLSDPELISPPSPPDNMPERMLPLWREALGHADSEVQRRAADAVARAFQQGYRQFAEARPELLRLLVEPKAHPDVRWTAAHALIVIGDRDADETLWKAASEDPRLRNIVEPTLADWGFEPILAVWRKRIADPQTPRRDLLLAVAGAAQAGDPEAIAPLLAIVEDLRRPADVRLAAARAAGAIAPAGLEPLARRLAAAPATIVDRLCAVGLLERHASPGGLEIKVELARDAEPAVAGAALGGLYGVDPVHVLPLADESLASRDANVRRWGLRAFGAKPDAHGIAALGTSLEDRHRGNRIFAREELIRLAADEAWNAAVRDAGMTALGRNDWRGQEQSAILMAALDHKPAADRLVELLESSRPEVMVASAWGLRVLAVPETAEAILDKATRQTRNPSADIEIIDPHRAHLFEALAVLGHQPAVPLLREYAPKDLTKGELSRSSAIWALGRLLEGTPDDDLAILLVGRINDGAGMPPEFPLVRKMSAVAIGQMKAVSRLDDLRAFVGPELDPNDVELAAYWSLRRMGGEEVPLAKIVAANSIGWFLEPR